MKRAAIVYFGNKTPIEEISKGLSKGIQSQGYIVDIIDALREPDKKLSIYQYIAVGTEVISLLGKRILPDIGPFLKGAGAVLGKMSYAFTAKSLLGSDKTLQELMRTMEGEGMLIRTSDVLAGPDQAERVGGKLHINK